MNDTKSGKRRELNACLSFNMAVELGFRGSLSEWERLWRSTEAVRRCRVTWRRHPAEG